MLSNHLASSFRKEERNNAKKVTLMSVQEKITDALDDENPNEEIAGILKDYIEAKDSTKFASVFRELIKVDKVALLVMGIKESLNLINAMPDARTKIGYYDGIMLVSSYPIIKEQFPNIGKDYVALCTSAGKYESAARYYINNQPQTEDNKELLDYNLTIGEFFIQAENYISANLYLNKAHDFRFIKTSLKRDLDRFDILRSEVMIGTQKYELASQLLYDISNNHADEKVRLNSLKRAVIFSIVSPPGPKRDAIFAKIGSDERAQELPIFQLFLKMNNRQTLGPEMIDRFWNDFKDEKSITREDLQSNFRMHNLTQIAHFYSVISIEHLAKMIELPEKEALDIIETMIQTGRLRAKIDQPHKMIIYTKDVMSQDHMIAEFSEHVDNVVNEILTA